MPIVTTAQLVDRAKALADMHDNFVTPTQWMYWATQERQALDLCLARSGWGMAFSTQTITVTGAEGGEFSLAVNAATEGGILAVVSVHEASSQGVRLLSYSDAVSFLHQLPGSTNLSRGHAKEYRLRWSQDTLTLNFFPEPIAGETYLVTYVPSNLQLTLDAPPSAGFTNSVAYPQGWEERIVLGMARRALIKEESSTSQIDREIQLWDSRIEEACWNHVLSQAPSIRNVDYATRGWHSQVIFPYPNNWWWS